MKIANKLKLLPIISAGLIFLMGIVLAAISNVTSELAVLLIMGLGVLAIGVGRLLYGWFARKEKDSIPNFVLGALDAVWGIIALALIATDGLFPLIFGIWLLTAGVVELAISIKYVLDRSPFAGIMIDGAINMIFGVMLFVQNFDNMTQLYLLTAAYLFVNTFTSLLVTVLASGDVGAEEAAVAEQPKAPEPAKAEAKQSTQIIIIKEGPKQKVAPREKDATEIVAEIVKEKEKQLAAKQKAAAKKAKAKKAAAKAKPAEGAEAASKPAVAKKPAAKKPAAKKATAK